jgi:hypothetical protein
MARNTGVSKHQLLARRQHLFRKAHELKLKYSAEAECLVIVKYNNSRRYVILDTASADPTAWGLNLKTLVRLQLP